MTFKRGFLSVETFTGSRTNTIYLISSKPVRKGYTVGNLIEVKIWPKEGQEALALEVQKAVENCLQNYVEKAPEGITG